MNNIQKRFLLFLFGCIFTRSLIVLISKHYLQYLPIMGIIAFIPAFCFIYIYINDLRKTGSEVFGDKIWWDHLRPFHGVLYALFGILAVNSYANSWVILLVDVIIGFISFIYFHYMEQNIYKLITINKD